ncbi:hypothetical protein CR513_23794, partial [Mucuna pruriens]
MEAIEALPRKLQIFKDRFFRVYPSEISPNIMVDSSSNPLFPFHWTCQPTVSKTVEEEDLEEWELEFVKKLQRLPTLPCADLIKKELKALREIVVSRSPNLVIAPLLAPSTQATTLSPALALPAQPIVEAHTEQLLSTKDALTWPPTPPTVILDSPTDSPVEAAPILEPVVKKRAQEVADSQDRQVRTKTASHIVAVVGAFASNPLEDWAAVLANRPSNPSVWAPNYPLANAGTLGISGVFQALQNYVGYSLVLSRATKRKFKSLEARNKGMAKTIEKSHEDNLKLVATLHDVEEKINCYKESTENLHDQLKVAVCQAKDHVLAKQESEHSKVEAIIKEKDIALAKQGLAIVGQFKLGFARVLEQIAFLHPSVDVSKAGPFKEVVDGRLTKILMPRAVIDRLPLTGLGAFSNH